MIIASDGAVNVYIVNIYVFPCICCGFLMIIFIECNGLVNDDGYWTIIAIRTAFVDSLVNSDIVCLMYERLFYCISCVVVGWFKV